MPQATNERRKRNREIIAENNQLTGGKIKSVYTQTGLKIGQTIYKKQVVSPTPSDLFDLSTKDFDKIMKIQTKKVKS